MQKNEFHVELDAFQIHLPGRNIIQFSDDAALQTFMNCQYPQWKTAGDVTSIPVGRIPRLFLTCDQMVASFEKRFKGIEKGETGEIAVYNELMKSCKELESGICVLPNIDGNHFESKDAHVEIDVVVVHPWKGVFVFNVKNTNYVKPKDLADDMRRHVNFIRLLFEFNSVDGEPLAKLPIHGIIASFVADVKEKALRHHGYFTDANENEYRLIFQPEDMKSFSLKWKSALSTIPSFSDYVFQKSIDVLMARLAVLNSMEGALALIHQRISSNEIHKINVKQKETQDVLKHQFPDCNSDECDTQLQEQLLIAMNLNKNCEKTKVKKKSVILWTKEQIKIISTVGRCLLKSKGCRIVVSGPRGSGKTMLLIFIADLAKNIFRSQKNDEDGNILICDGRRGASQILFDKLKMHFENTGIDVSLIYDKQRERRLILFDEFNADFSANLTSLKFKKNQHVIFFSSRPQINGRGLHSSYQSFTLSNTLRATAALTRFIEEFRVKDPGCNEFPTVASHNFEGSNPDVKYVFVETAGDPFHMNYVNAAVSAIMENLERARGLDEILITPFVHPITMERILCEIQKEGVDYQYFNPADSMSKSKSLEHCQSDNVVDTIENTSVLPKIIFVTGNHVDGAEYGAAIVLLERSLPHWWDEYIFDSVFIAITRATTHLCIIINNTEEAPMILQPTDNKVSVPHVEKEMQKPSDIHISAYNYLVSSPDRFPMALEKIIDESYWSKFPVLVVGKCPIIPPYFQEIEKPSSYFFHKRDGNFFQNEDGMETNWFCGPSDKLLVVLAKAVNLRVFLRYYFSGDLHGFSAMVFITHTMTEYVRLCELIGRHALLYFMYEHQIGSCPLYLLQSFSTLPSRADAHSICDYFVDHHDSRIIDSAHSYVTSEVQKETSKERFISWLDIKTQGISFFKEGNLDSALTYFMESVDVFMQTEYSVRMCDSNIKSMIKLSEELAKLYTNISKVYFDKGSLIETDLRQTTFEASLKYAEKSIVVNPCWLKGYHRVIEASRLLGDEKYVQEILETCDHISMLDEKDKFKMQRDAVLDSKMCISPSWNLVKYKDNAFIIDKSGEGHFLSILEALEIHGNQDISLLINPGVHDCHYPVLISDGTIVDLVGNWDASLCHENKWILEEPPIVIRNISSTFPPCTFFVNNSTVSFARLSLCIWPSGHVVLAINANITLQLCFFHSPWYVAISCEEGTNLSIDGCRSVNSYGVVLAANGCFVQVSNSFFCKTKVACLEFRENVTANVEHCTVKQCEAQGVACTRGQLNIISCFFEKNSYKMTWNEGSIQIGSTETLISNTHIQNQLGCGIVIEEGSGRFENLKIDRCQLSGILIQAPCTVTKCAISNCKYGVKICRNTNGDVHIMDTVIRYCQLQVFRFPGAPSPFINGGNVSLSRIGQSITDIEKSSLYLHIKGKLLHEKILNNHDIIEMYGHGPLRSALLENSLDPNKHAPCMYCTLPVFHHFNTKYMLCEGCENYFYCCVDCCEKDKERHKVECEWIHTVVKKYRKSINWKKVSEKSKANNVSSYPSTSKYDSSKSVSMKEPRKWMGSGKEEEKSQWSKHDQSHMNEDKFLIRSTSHTSSFTSNIISSTTCAHSNIYKDIFPIKKQESRSQCGQSDDEDNLGLFSSSCLFDVCENNSFYGESGIFSDGEKNGRLPLLTKCELFDYEESLELDSSICASSDTPGNSIDHESRNSFDAKEHGRQTPLTNCKLVDHEDNLFNSSICTSGDMCATNISTCKSWEYSQVEKHEKQSRFTKFEQSFDDNLSLNCLPCTSIDDDANNSLLEKSRNFVDSKKKKMSLLRRTLVAIGTIIFICFISLVGNLCQFFMLLIILTFIIFISLKLFE